MISSLTVWFLFILAAPIFTKRPPTLTIPLESTDFSEICQAEGFPNPVSNWTRLFQPFPLVRTEVNGGSLTIRNLSTTDSGLYECVVANDMGVKKARMNLVVQKGGEHCIISWRSNVQFSCRNEKCNFLPSIRG